MLVSKNHQPNKLACRPRSPARVGGCTRPMAQGSLWPRTMAVIRLQAYAGIPVEI